MTNSACVRMFDPWLASVIGSHWMIVELLFRNYRIDRVAANDRGGPEDAIVAARLVVVRLTLIVVAVVAEHHRVCTRRLLVDRK